jgi:double-strand break repair protein MRE11
MNDSEEVPQPVKKEQNQYNEPEGDTDVFRILVVTDTHLGYMERDPIRGNDSFTTWEECLKQAVALKVDFILHGGDFFHDNKPSRRTLFRTMELLRKYCFGEKNIDFQIVSDQTKNFPNFKTVNYEDPNFNVSIPIFVVHGNHDDPSGDGQYSAIDILSAANMVNYFGKMNNIDEIAIYPILLTKGSTKLALYGLGNIRDERLHRTWAQKKVNFMRPTEGREEWFSLFTLHQNRISHSPKNYINEAFFDRFLDFIVWGHEHECKITPTPSSEGEFYISQPGSTIATALSESESVEKHIGLLEIHERDFRLSPIKLSTVRPFIMEDLVLSTLKDEIKKHMDSSARNIDPDLKNVDPEIISRYLHTKVEAIIERVKKSAHEDGKKEALPLIRLRVEYTGFNLINLSRFGQLFVGKVANPMDILNFFRKKVVVRAGQPNKQLEKDILDAATKPDTMDEVAIEDLIESYLSTTQGKSGGPMDILIESDFNVALHNFVEKDDRTAIEEFVKGRLSIVQELCRKQNPDHVNNIDDIQKFILSNTSKNRSIQDAKNESKPKIKLQKDEMNGNDEDDDDMNDLPSIKSEKASTQKKTKAAAGGKKLLTKRGKKKQSSSEEDDEVSENSFIVDDDVPVTKKKTQTRAASQRTQTQTKKRAHASSEEDSDGSDDSKSKPPAKKTRGAAKGVATKQTKLTPSKTATKSQLNFFDMTDDDDNSSSKKSGSSMSDSINVNSNSWGGKKTKK